MDQGRLSFLTLFKNVFCCFEKSAIPWTLIPVEIKPIYRLQTQGRWWRSTLLCGVLAIGFQQTEADGGASIASGSGLWDRGSLCTVCPVNNSLRGPVGWWMGHQTVSGAVAGQHLWPSTQPSEEASERQWVLIQNLAQNWQPLEDWLRYIKKWYIKKCVSGNSPWPEEKQENPIKKKLCSGCQHFGKKMKVESSGLIFCASCQQKNTRAKSKWTVKCEAEAVQWLHIGPSPS